MFFLLLSFPSFSSFFFCRLCFSVFFFKYLSLCFLSFQFSLFLFLLFILYIHFLSFFFFFLHYFIALFLSFLCSFFLLLQPPPTIFKICSSFPHQYSLFLFSTLSTTNNDNCTAVSGMHLAYFSPNCCWLLLRAMMAAAAAAAILMMEIYRSKKTHSHTWHHTNTQCTCMLIFFLLPCLLGIL